MSEDTSARRRTRRTGTTRTAPRGAARGTPFQRILYSPLTPDELEWMIAEAREQRTAEDIADYETRKRTQHVRDADL